MASTADASSATVVDVLSALLEAEMNSVFRFMGEGSPYLSRATAEVRRPLHEMVETIEPRVVALAEMIESLGGVPPLHSVTPEEQYLAFLSLRFLLPKLVDVKALMIQRYENALKALSSADEACVEVVQSHLAEHREQLQTLRAAAQAAAA